MRNGEKKGTSVPILKAGTTTVRCNITVSRSQTKQTSHVTSHVKRTGETIHQERGERKKAAEEHQVHVTAAYLVI